MGKFGGGKVWQSDSFQAFGKRKFGELRIKRLANRSFIVSIDLDGFSLVNHGQFTKFTKLSHRQTFPLYGMHAYAYVSSRMKQKS